MSFAYVAGSTTPGLIGLAELPNLRMNDDGTFRPLSIPPNVQSAPLRFSTMATPRDGGYVGDPLLDVWQFNLDGWLYVPDETDVQGAIDYLLANANVALGWMTLTLDASSWSDARIMTVRVAGQVGVTTFPDKGEMKAPTRVFTLPLIAADPRRYGATAKSVPVTSGTPLTNAGNYNTPITVRFYGPQTNPKLDGPGAAGSNRIRYSGTIPSGGYVEVNTDDPTTATMTAVDDTGADAYGDGSSYGSGVSAATADFIAPGTSSWTATNDSGAGSTVVTFRDAYA